MSKVDNYSRFTNLLQRLIRLLHTQIYFYSLRQGISLSEYQVLSFLSSGIPVGMNEVKNNLFVAGAFATNIADRLVKKGLIWRHRNDNDRRKVLIALTNKGKRYLVKLEAYEKKFFKALIGDLRENDKKAMESGISILIASLESIKRV